MFPKRESEEEKKGLFLFAGVSRGQFLWRSVVIKWVDQADQLP